MSDRVANDIGQMLVERASACDVQRLSAAANAQDRQLEAHGLTSNGVLERVKTGLGRTELDMLPRTVRRRRKIRTAREHQPIQPGNQRRSVRRRERRHRDRQRPSRRDRTHVRHPERHLGIRRLPMAPQRGELTRQAAAQMS